MLSFRSRVVIIVLGMVIGISSLLFTNDMARQLREKEQNEVAIWAAAFRELGADPGNPLLLSIITTRNNIPFILTDGALRVEYSHLIPDYILNHPNLLRDKLDQMTKVNPHLKVQTLYNETLYIFFDESRLLKTLVYFPYIQLLVIIVFVVFGYITFRSTKQDEQNRVWIGLAKETAHQLGTPTSSLLGWLEYLKTQNIDQTAIDEMGKDIVRLTKVVDRFSKIGAATPLSEGVINEIVGNSVIYFRTRVPKNVTLTYNGLAMAQQKAMINEALFEWVIENLLKNAMDACREPGRSTSNFPVTPTGFTSMSGTAARGSRRGISNGSSNPVLRPKRAVGGSDFRSANGLSTDTTAVRSSCSIPRSTKERPSASP